MPSIENHKIKRTIFFTTLAIASISIQVIAQSFYPIFDYSADNSNIESSAKSQVNN